MRRSECRLAARVMLYQILTPALRPVPPHRQRRPKAAARRTGCNAAWCLMLQPATSRHIRDPVI